MTTRPNARILLHRCAHPQDAAVNPARLLDNNFTHVPESWRQAMQLDRPMEGLNLCHIHGRPGTHWTFAAEGGPNLTMGVLLAGRMEAGLDDGAQFRLTPDQAILMASGQHTRGWNALSAPGDFHLLNINLTGQALLNLTGLRMEDTISALRTVHGDMAHVNASTTTMPVFSALQRIVGDMLRCSYSDPRARNVFLRAKVAECLAAMLEHCALARGAPGVQRATPGDRQRLLRARALLEARYGEAWSVPLLARAVGLNEKRLQTGFQALYGTTVHVCLTRIRLDAAQARLASGHSVTDTALAAGFANVSHFSKVFRQHMGVSPHSWVRG